MIDDINRGSAEIAHIEAEAKESADGLLRHRLGEAN
jgi:hypothetical protein